MSRENSRGPRVLIVEDEGLIRWALATTLDAAGASVVEASDAEAAIAALHAETGGFDVAVLDVRLPDANGLSLLAVMRRRWPAVRVLVMTAFGNDEVHACARALGALRVVDKPFDLDVMRDLVFEATAAG